MGISMSWIDFCKDDPVSVQRAAQAIRRAVQLQRRTGLKKDDAIETVADLFHLSPRRVRTWAYDQIINPSLRECTLIIHRWWAARDLEVARLRAIADHEEREMERERIALLQLELPLGMVNAQKTKSVDRGVPNEMARLAGHLDRFAKAEAAYRAARRGPLK